VAFSFGTKLRVGHLYVKLCSAHPTYCGHIIGNQISRIDRSFSHLLQVQSYQFAGAAEVTNLNFKFAVTFQSYDCSSRRLSHFRSNFAPLPHAFTSQLQHILPWLTRKAAL
jgi:hypothetical protein